MWPPRGAAGWEASGGVVGSRLGVEVAIGRPIGAAGSRAEGRDAAVIG